MTVAQVVADGWRTVTPMTLRLASGAFLTNADLANFKLGTIRGQVYDDANANGIKDAGESGLSGVVVFLDATDNGQLDFGESSAVSDAQGRYAFLSLTPGNYRVRQIALVGSYQRAAVPAGRLCVGVESQRRVVRQPGILATARRACSTAGST